MNSRWRLAFVALLFGPEAAVATRVKRAFDAQRRAEDRLRSFVADAGHELRTPLATMHGWIDLYVQGGLTDPDRLDHAMARMQVEVGRMRCSLTSWRCWPASTRPSR
jgi:two-component system OmpR family sensor kinase